MMRELSTFFLATAVLIFSISPVLAQTPAASVSIDCEEVMQISVSPGSSTTESVTCVVENPTVYEEKIQITVDAANLTYSAPGSITVQGGSSESFQLVIVAEEGMPARSHSVNVEVSVQEINSLPPANVAKDDSNIVVEILRFGDCSISTQTSLAEFTTGSDQYLEFLIGNLGNGADLIDISLSTNSKSSLDEAGYLVSISSPTLNLNEGESTFVSVAITSPSQMSSSAKNEGSFLIDLHLLELVATSEYSCDSSSGCSSDSTSVTLKLVGENGGGNEFVDSINDEESSVSGNEVTIFGSGVLAGLIVFFVLFAIFKKS